MLFHGRQNAQIALNASGVVIADILLHHLNKDAFAGEASAVIAFPLQNAPEALHRAVVNAMRHPGHALCHARLHKPAAKCAVGVLEPSVAMEQRMRIRILPNRLVEGFENQRIVVALAERAGHSAPVAQIQNGAQIELVDLVPFVPLEFRHVGEPLLVWLCGAKLPVQKIFGKILRIFRASGAAAVIVPDRGADPSDPADAECSLVVDMNAAAWRRASLSLR